MSNSAFWSKTLFWLFVPPLASKTLLNLIYRTFGRKISAKPGSPRHTLHSKLSYLFVVICIFGFQAHETIVQSGQSYYQAMGLRRFEVDQKLKTNFRHRVISLHPDKNSEGDGSEFIDLKNIYEILGSTSSRVAYDCYGEDNVRQASLNSAKASAKPSLKDHFIIALYDWIGFYAGAVIVYFIQYLGSNRGGTYWKSISLISTMSIDLYILMHPAKYGIASDTSLWSNSMGRWWMKMWEDIPTFAKISLLRQLYMLAGITIGHTCNMGNESSPPKLKKALIQHINISTIKCLAIEGRLMISSQLLPFLENEERQEILKNEVARNNLS